VLPVNFLRRGLVLQGGIFIPAIRTIALCEFPQNHFSYGAGITTWPSLQTALNTEANAGSSRIAPATLNEGSGSGFRQRSCGHGVAYPPGTIPEQFSFLPTPQFGLSWPRTTTTTIREAGIARSRLKVFADDPVGQAIAPMARKGMAPARGGTLRPLEVVFRGPRTTGKEYTHCPRSQDAH